MSKKISLLVLAGALAVSAGCGLLKKKQPVNVSLDGTIQQGDSVLEQDNSLYDEYKIEVENGWQVRAVMTSPSFDTYLILLDPQGNRVAYNDDDASLGGSGTNSQFTHTVTAAGEYKVYANSYQAGQVGPYHITIQAGPAGSLPPAPAALPAAAPVAPAQ